jgi:hypothetical protein
VPLSRRQAITILAASATVVAVDGIPAHADEQPPMVFSAHSLGFEYLGYLELYLRAFYSAITQVRAHLVSKVDGSEAGTVEEFDHLTNDPADGYWTAKNPVLLPSLGLYQVDVEIWTAGGAYAYQRNAGELTYFALATIGDLQITPDRPTTDHRFVTVSGQLLDKHPGTLALSPVAHGKVRLETGGQASETLSGPDGRFSVDVPIEGSAAIGVTPVADPDNYRLADRTAWQLIEPLPGPSRIVVTATPQSVDAGQPTTISGLLEAEQGGAWVPLANRKITIGSMGYPFPESR